MGEGVGKSTVESDRQLFMTIKLTNECVWHSDKLSLRTLNTEHHFCMPIAHNNGQLQCIYICPFAVYDKQIQCE